MTIERASANCATRNTADDWVSAVRRSIGTMRENLGEEHSLRTLARSAWLSPFHFHRVFLKVTDSTPARFLAAWRMAEAKRLLAYGEATVTEICMHIGYSSLGTFTSQFTRTVGVSPGRFRRLLAAYGDRPFNDLLRELSRAPAAPGPAAIAVSVLGGPPDVPVVVGLFPSGIPQERPVACAVLPGPGTAWFGTRPDGADHPLAMAFDESVSVVEAVAATDLDRCYVGAGEVPPAAAAPPATVEIRLRRRRPTDPPIVLALPLLLAADHRGVPAVP
jgi:AraC family transcriptional regulator